jgi:glycosyltransferase involved in cell wall biosynthesis
MIRVTSTALNVGQLAYKSVRSVAEQTYKNWSLDFFDAKSEDNTVAEARWATIDDSLGQLKVTVHEETTRSGPLDKLVPFWRSLPDDDIIVWLDGDDRLATDSALETVALYHAMGAIVTYGSCLRSDGGVVTTGPVGKNPRTDTAQGAWLLGHLKTFRAGAFKQIKDEDLRDADGRYYSLSIDRAVMLPLVESFPTRSLWVNRYLYAYTWDVSYDANATPEQAARARDVTTRIHALPPYSRNPWLPGDVT